MAPITHNHAENIDSLLNLEKEFVGIKDQVQRQENMLKQIYETVMGLTTLFATRKET